MLPPTGALAHDLKPIRARDSRGLWSARHTERGQTRTRVSALAFAAALAAGAASTRNARANDDLSPLEGDLVTAVQQPDFAKELRLIAGGAALGLTQMQDVGAEATVRVGDVGAATFGLGYQWGWFAGQHVQLGFAHSLVRYEWVGQHDVQNGTSFGEVYWTQNTSYTVLSPVGLFVELHPLANSGLFVGASAAVGLVPTWQGLFGESLVMAGYGLEVGHEIDTDGKRGWGALLRYANWVGTQNFLHTDYPAGVVSHELTLVGRWSFEGQ